MVSHNLGGIAYVYRLEGHELRFDPCRRRPAYKDDLGGQHQRLGHLPLFRSSLTPLHRELVAHIHPPLLQFWRYAPEEDVQAQDQGGEA